jgi:hypothetical protein
MSMLYAYVPCIHVAQQCDWPCYIDKCMCNVGKGECFLCGGGLPGSVSPNLGVLLFVTSCTLQLAVHTNCCCSPTLLT